MTQSNGLERRLAALERRVAELSANVWTNRNLGMTGPEFVAFMREYGGKELGPIFDEALKLRQQDREKAHRKFDRAKARKGSQKIGFNAAPASHDMILLDTDQLSILNRLGTTRAEDLMARLAAASDERITVTVISVVEQFRGWSADINKAQDVSEEVWGYAGLSRFVEVLRAMTVIPFDAAAADLYVHLRRLKLRIGTMDLKIAAIAIANGALLLTANRRDFAKMPGLRFENWLV